MLPPGVLLVALCKISGSELRFVKTRRCRRSIKDARCMLGGLVVGTSPRAAWRILRIAAPPSPSAPTAVSGSIGGFQSAMEPMLFALKRDEKERGMKEGEEEEEPPSFSLSASYPFLGAGRGTQSSSSGNLTLLAVRLLSSLLSFPTSSHLLLLCLAPVRRYVLLVATTLAISRVNVEPERAPPASPPSPSIAHEEAKEPVDGTWSSGRGCHAGMLSQ